jgi:hypothetical protein
VDTSLIVSRENMSSTDDVSAFILGDSAASDDEGIEGDRPIAAGHLDTGSREAAEQFLDDLLAEQLTPNSSCGAVLLDALPAEGSSTCTGGTGDGPSDSGASDSSGEEELDSELRKVPPDAAADSPERTQLQKRLSHRRKLVDAQAVSLETAVS